jgi:hypothetical protein
MSDKLLMKQNLPKDLVGKNKIYFLAIAIIIILFISSEYFLIHKGFYAISADESGHTLDAYFWYIGQGSLFSIWLPFQKLIYSAAFFINKDLFFTPRVVSILFGVFTILSIADLTLQLLGNKFIALLTCFVSILFLPLSIFSVLPLEEIYFFFFTTFSLTFLFRWINTNKNIHLWLSIISSSINTTTRYEAWLFTFIIFVIIVFRIIKGKSTKRKKFFIIVIIALLLSAFPLYWVYLSYINTGSITGFIHSVTQRYGSPLISKRFQNNVLYNFLLVNINSLNILGVISLILLFKNKKNVKYFAFLFTATILIFSITTFIINAMPTHNFWRLAMIWSLLLLPFTAYLLYYFIEKGFEKKIFYLPFFALFFILIFLFTKQTIAHSNYSYITKDDLTAGRTLESLLKNNDDKVYISSYNSWDRSSVMVTSQFPERFVSNLNGYYNGIDLTINMNNRMINKLKEMNIGYFVLRPFYKINGSKFHIIKRFTMWDIYKVPN